MTLVVEFLIRNMAQADSVGPEVLLKASSECKLRLVRLLIDGGTLANVRNSNQETPLILACKSENPEKEKVVEFLIKHRVKMNLQDVDGKTALMHACLTNSSDSLIRMLVNAKANPWIKDENKNTAFDYAINAGNIGTVKVMIQACREGKILSKPGSFNMEMKRLEDKLDQLPELRKCSWPLMGPRNTPTKEKKVSQQSELLAVEEDDENESPSRERRRKKSICHFDPIDIDVNNAKQPEETHENLTKPLRKSSLYSVGCSSEDERISLHFSDSDNSSFDRSSAHFSSLEKLLKIRDSVTSSLESNDSLNVQSPSSKFDPEKQKHQLSPQNKETSEALSDLVESVTSHENDSSFKLGKPFAKTELKRLKEEEKRLFSSQQEHENQQQKHLSESKNHQNSLPLREKLPSPSVGRRKTFGSCSRRNEEPIKSGADAASGSENAIRRFTVSTMEGSVRSHPIEISSPEIKLNRSKFRPLEVLDMTSREKTKRNSLDNIRPTKMNDIAHKTDLFRPIALPIISKPDDGQNDGQESKITKNVEKMSVRRTLSDSICQSKRTNVVTSRNDNRLGVSRSDYFADQKQPDLFSSPVEPVYRERSLSSPIAPPQTPPSQRRTSLTTRCEVVVSSSTTDVPRSRSPRYTVCGDLPDLVLLPAQYNRSSSNLEVQNNDQLAIQRLCRSVSPEVLAPVSPGGQLNVKSSSYSYLPEASKNTTGSPKEKRAALLPPLNISRKPHDEEEGYFSCSPSPLDLVSPNRKEKTRYSFKPLSPRLVSKPVKNVLP